MTAEPRRWLGTCLSAKREDPVSSLLLDILLSFSIDHSKRLFSRDLAARLGACAHNSSWAEARKGKPITELWLSQKLRPYGIRPKTIWIGEDHAKGYLLDDFTETFRRYIPKAEAQAYMDELRQPAPKPADRG